MNCVCARQQGRLHRYERGDDMKNDVLYSVKAQRGSLLRCKGWKQEVLLRMLENNMENA